MKNTEHIYKRELPIQQISFNNITIKRNKNQVFYETRKTIELWTISGRKISEWYKGIPLRKGE